MSYCYQCPASVVYTSNLSIILAFALVVVIIGGVHLDDTYLKTLAPHQLEVYRCMQKQRCMHLIVGIVIGGCALVVFKPYSVYKLV